MTVKWAWNLNIELLVDDDMVGIEYHLRAERIVDDTKKLSTNN